MRFSQVTRPEDISDVVREALIGCWLDVSNAGGAVGFPFPPVLEGEVSSALDAIVGRLDPATCRLVMALDGDALVGWFVIRRDGFALISHWGTLHHVQSRPDRRGEGVGSALVEEAHRIARDELGLEQLHLAARAGMGLESFYERLGWEEVGRWPGALRLAPGDDRDEVLMLRQL